MPGNVQISGSSVQLFHLKSKYAGSFSYEFRNLTQECETELERSPKGAQEGN